MIRLRKECPEIGWGEWQILATRSPAVLAVAYRWRGRTVVCVHNVTAEAREVSLQLGGGLLSDLIEVDELTAKPDAAHRVRVDPYGYRWFRLDERNTALTR
jgi:maltose alpha-D-glucosyltransferase/alpha-amylase